MRTDRRAFVVVFFFRACFGGLKAMLQKILLKRTKEVKNDLKHSINCQYNHFGTIYNMFEWNWFKLCFAFDIECATGGNDEMWSVIDHNTIPVIVDINKTCWAIYISISLGLCVCLCVCYSNAGIQFQLRFFLDFLNLVSYLSRYLIGWVRIFCWFAFCLL